MAVQSYSEKFEEILNITRKLAQICGLLVTNKDFKRDWKTYFVFFLINCGLVLSFYTVYIESILTGDHTNFFKTVSVIGTAFQGYTKFMTALKWKNELCFLDNESTRIYRTYERKSAAYQKALKYNITVVKQLLSTVFTIVIITSTIMIMFPVFMYFVYNKRYEILPYQIPFIDNKTHIGYLLTSFTQIVVVFFAGYGNFVADSWLFIFTAQIPLMKNILKCKFEELDEISKAHPRDVRKSIGLLNDILKWHQKYINFSNTIKDTFFWVIFVQVSTEFLSIAFSIVCIFLDIWPPAPIFVFYLYAMIYAFCALGNLVEAANNDITTIIYDSCWYNLTIAEQKMILFMLRASQQAAGITIGGIAPLSLNTALQLTKTIYTFSMMLEEFLMD